MPILSHSVDLLVSKNKSAQRKYWSICLGEQVKERTRKVEAFSVPPLGRMLEDLGGG